MFHRETYNNAPNMDKKIKLPSLDFVAGVIATSGSFLWIKQNKTKIPVFQIKTHISDAPLIELIKTKLGLTEKIYRYTHSNRNYVLLLIRSKETIKKNLFPTLNGRLYGKRKDLFKKWKKEVLNLKSMDKKIKLIISTVPRGTA